MPEDVPFNCRVCNPERPSPWEMFVKQEMFSGMTEVLDTLLTSHCSILLQPFSHPCHRPSVGDSDVPVDFSAVQRHMESGLYSSIVCTPVVHM